MTTPPPGTPPAPAYELPFAPIAIHDAGGAAALAPAPSDTLRDAYVGPFGGERRNGRLAWPLTPGHWSIETSWDLLPDLYPRAVYATGDRVLVHGGDLWQLFAADGRSLAKGRLGAGGTTLDPARGCFYAADPTGPLRVWKLADGAAAFAIEPYFGANYERAHVARHGDAITIGSIERVSDPHGGHRPKVTALEVQRVAEAPAVTRAGFLERTDRPGKLMLSSADVAIAGSETGLVVASHDTIYLAGPDLKIASALRGSFDALAVSLDERDRIVLLARAGTETFVWMLERDGRRLFACDVEAIAAADVTPPAIGLDHRVWVRAGRRLTAIGPEGRRLATGVAAAPYAGLTLTRDGWALATEGSSVVALRPATTAKEAGTFERHVLFTAPDGPLATPAVLLADGKMVVCSGRRLYRLAASLE